MHFIYVDESGDPGLFDPSKPRHFQASQHYIVSGLIVPEIEWRNYLQSWLDFRRYLKAKYQFPVREELHGAELVKPHKQAAVRQIGSKSRRIDLYKECLEQVCIRMPSVKVLNVRLDKLRPQYSYMQSPEGIQCRAWERLLERFNSFLQRDCNGERGIIFADQTNELIIRRLVRKMRVHHYSGSYFGGGYANPMTQILEDPVMRNSAMSYFVQISDLISHALYRKLYPKGSLRRFNVDKLFDALSPILHLPASGKDPHRQGIVHC
jgi:Protein of unknown function (DUF3800)